MDEEIKPKMVNGEAVCQRMCPQYALDECATSCARGVCWPWYRRRVEQLQTEVDGLRCSRIEAARIGYMAGHDDTVESRYADPGEMAHDICQDLDDEAE